VGFPPYELIAELERAVGFDDGSPIERRATAHASAIEKAQVEWRAEDAKMRTVYGGSSEDESAGRGRRRNKGTRGKLYCIGVYLVYLSGVLHSSPGYRV